MPLDSMRGWLGAWGIALLVFADANGGRVETDSPSRGLAEKMANSGRAEVALERVTLDPLTGEERSVRGALVLEPPDRAALRFPATGERITMRADGGEWLQPELRQTLLLGPERSAAARRWWDVLLPGENNRVVSRRLGPGRFLVRLRDSDRSFPDSAWVWLDPAGLPSRLEITEEGDSPTVYRFGAWRFSRPRGREAFVIRPPPDHEIVRLP